MGPKHRACGQFRLLTGALVSERATAIERCVATLDRDAGALQALNEAILTPI